MAYDETLARRIRHAIGSRAGVTEKKMFGGVAFLLHGKMFSGVVKDDLMVRVGPKRYEDALARPHARPMDFTGRPMKGYVFVGPAGCGTEKAVAAWVEQGADLVAELASSDRPKKARPQRAGSPHRKRK